MHRAAAAFAAGLLFDGGRNDGWVRDARLVQAVGMMGHHVGGEAAGHQAGERGRREGGGGR